MSTAIRAARVVMPTVQTAEDYWRDRSNEQQVGIGFAIDRGFWDSLLDAERDDMMEAAQQAAIAVVEEWGR